MRLRSQRLGLTIMLSALAALCVLFYTWQNSGQRIGGPISVPKILWLGYALAAWFVMPFFLWRDGRLAARVRQMYGFFWLLWLLRGAAELVLLFVFQHWTP